MNSILFLVVGIAIGAGLVGVGAWVLIRREKQSAEAQMALQRAHTDDILRERDRRDAEAKAEREAQERRAKEEREAQERRAKEEREAQMRQQIALLKKEFETSSQQLLRERQQEFRTSSTESIEQMLRPLREQIGKMSSDMLVSKGSQQKLEEVMKEQIRLLLDQTQMTAESANNLTMALRGQNKTQGDYGERRLTDMLQSLGFQEGVQILPQEYITDRFGRKIRDDEEQKMRPDVILKTDANHVVIIDSKMVLKDYMDYVAAFNRGDEQAMAAAIEGNTNAILGQVNLLSKQNYAAYIQKPYETVEYTLMYVPVSGALRLAQANRPGLWHEAMAKKVLIVDEYTLYAMLRVIEITWAKIDQMSNSQKIVDAATLVLERVEALLEKVVDAETAVKKASESLQEGHALLTNGGTSIVTAANTLKNLGVRPKSKEYAKRLKKTAPIHEQLGEAIEAVEAERSAGEIESGI